MAALSHLTSTVAGCPQAACTRFMGARPCQVPGDPADRVTLDEQDGITVTVFASEVARRPDHTHIWAVRNPDKLRPWAPGCRCSASMGRIIPYRL